MKMQLNDYSIYSLATTILIVACLLAPAEARSKAEPPPVAAKTKLARVAPKSIEEAMASFEVADGFRIELVAAEPDVIDPIAMAFDEAGRLYVVEMRDYSELDKARLGRVRLLSDEDGDGRFETSQIFADGLSWPTAIACYDGGVFVGAAPDILYLKDTNGDDRADQRQVVFTGFGRSNVQGLLNGFQWGLDNSIHGATSSSGASVTRPGSDAPPVELRGRDFAFDPKTLDIKPETGGGQHGLTFNRWGDKFVCSNSDHLQAIVFEERYLARNPLQNISGARRPIATDGRQSPVYRISPVEAWRTARTRMRVAGLAPGPIEGGGTAAGYFTSATGITIYEGDLWPEEFRGWALIADVGSNLIHRKRMSPDGVTYRGERVDPESEFVRSRDIWFRPVQMANGPDGALYVADMYREVIEHPASLPAELKSQLDLNSGNDRGRIFRIVPEDSDYAPPKSLKSATAEELVTALTSKNAWRRTTAARLLYERQDPAIPLLLRAQLSRTKLPEGRVAILYALGGQNALGADDVAAALTDQHPQVRRHAVRLSEPLVSKSAALRQNLAALANDPDDVVLFQLALSAGELPPDEAGNILAKLLVRRSAQRDVANAALTSMSDCAGPVLEHLLADRKEAELKPMVPVVEAIIGQILRQNREADLVVLVRLLEQAQDNPDSALAPLLLSILSRAPQRTIDEGASSASRRIETLRRTATAKLVEDARRVLDDLDAPLPERIAAVSALGLADFDQNRDCFDRLLEPRHAPAIHSAVLETCTRFSSPEVADVILSHWESFAPQQRTLAVDTLLRRETWLLALLEMMDDNQLAIATLDPNQVAKLNSYPSKKVQDVIERLVGQGNASDRQSVFADYQAVVATVGNATNGATVFRQHCATCHEHDSTGHAVGPNLASMANRGAESILFNVLVPNGEVNPRYVDYVVLTVDGEVLSGVIAGETSTAITLRGQDDKARTVLRVDIDELRSTGKSLMPEGFEKVIDKQAMADLLTYLTKIAPPGEPAE